MSREWYVSNKDTFGSLVIITVNVFYMLGTLPFCLVITFTFRTSLEHLQGYKYYECPQILDEQIEP
jgi:hypothetical protein